MRFSPAVFECLYVGLHESRKVAWLMLQTVEEGKWRLSRDAVMELMEVVVPEFLNSM